LAEDNIIFTQEPAEHVYPDELDGDNECDGPIIDIYYANEQDSSNSICMNLIPEDLAEKAGGELKLNRFTNVSKSWILNQEN
jgi:hypothetical protein